MSEKIEAWLTLALLFSAAPAVFIYQWVMDARKKRRENPLQAKPTVYVDRDA